MGHREGQPGNAAVAEPAAGAQPAIGAGPAPAADADRPSAAGKKEEDGAAPAGLARPDPAVLGDAHIKQEAAAAAQALLKPEATLEPVKAEPAGAAGAVQPSAGPAGAPITLQPDASVPEAAAVQPAGEAEPAQPITDVQDALGPKAAAAVAAAGQASSAAQPQDALQPASMAGHQAGVRPAELDQAGVQAPLQEAAAGNAEPEAGSWAAQQPSDVQELPGLGASEDDALFTAPEDSPADEGALEEGEAVDEQVSRVGASSLAVVHAAGAACWWTGPSPHCCGQQHLQTQGVGLQADGEACTDVPTAAAAEDAPLAAGSAGLSCELFFARVPAHCSELDVKGIFAQHGEARMPARVLS